jgi:hypothetical protein
MMFVQLLPELRPGMFNTEVAFIAQALDAEEAKD